MSIQTVEKAIKQARDTIKEYPSGWAEMQTRYVLIDPVLKALRWDFADPKQCNFEHPRTPKGEKMKKVDYAFFNPDQREYSPPNYPNHPVILLEAKALNSNLDEDKTVRQLQRYVNTKPQIKAGYAVLTDGKVWKIYDLGERGKFPTKLIKPSLDIINDDLGYCAKQLYSKLGKHIWWG